MIYAYLAWGFLRRDLRAWWTALAFTSIGAVSTVVGLARGNLWEAFSKAGLKGQVERLLPNFPRFVHVVLAASLLLTLVELAVLLYSRRYFEEPTVPLLQTD